MLQTFHCTWNQYHAPVAIQSPMQKLSVAHAITHPRLRSALHLGCIQHKPPIVVAVIAAAIVTVVVVVIDTLSTDAFPV
jgi:hypothetical protein